MCDVVYTWKEVLSCETAQKLTNLPSLLNRVKRVRGICRRELPCCSLTTSELQAPYKLQHLYVPKLNPHLVPTDLPLPTTPTTTSPRAYLKPSPRNSRTMPSNTLAPPTHSSVHLHPPRSTSPRPHRTSSRPSSPSFHPPFYNRPPTPLPPSPSLTSLLRPSTYTPSRPTTPDSSDSDTIPLSSTLSLSRARYAPKVPTYEYYGFVLYILANFSAAVYIIWALAPKELLESVGIYYYPSRWWSVVVPSWLVVAVVYVFVALAALNLGVLTKELGVVEAVVDEAGVVATERRRWVVSTDAVMDVPLGGVCEVLYGGVGGEELRDGDVFY